MGEDVCGVRWGEDDWGFDGVMVGLVIIVVGALVDGVTVLWFGGWL